jgi:hypothetical protein
LIEIAEQQPSPSCEAFIARVRTAAAPIQHCGDYCHIYYHQGNNQLWLTLGDGDPYGPDADSQTFEYIRGLFASFNFTQIFIEGEHDPELHQGWVRLPGKFGTEWHEQECLHCNDYVWADQSDPSKANYCPRCKRRFRL